MNIIRRQPYPDYILGKRVRDSFSGSMGIVYVLENNTVAKQVRPELLQDQIALDLFKREAEFMISCDEHPNVVAWLDLVEQDGVLYIISEYIPGGSLRKRILSRTCSPKQSACWAVHVCFAMVHMHRMGAMVHRDIKPENILLDGDDAKLADFGLAQVLQRLAREPMGQLEDSDYRNDSVILESASGDFLCGTPAYMAPELIEGTPADERSDLYSFGIVLYEMLTSKFPTRHRDGRIPAPSVLNSAVPSRLDEICMRLVQSNPRDRYPSFRHLFVDFERITQGAAGEYHIIGMPEFRITPITDLLSHPDFMALPYSRSAPLVRVYAFYKTGNYEQALSFIDFYGKDEDLSWLVEKAWCLGELGRFDQALTVCERVLVEDPQNSKALVNKGTCLARMDRVFDAITCFRAAREIQKDIGDKEEEGRCLGNLGIAYENLGQYKKAIEYSDQALQIAKDIGDKKEEGSQLGNLGIAFLNLGDSRKGIEYCEQALQIAKDIGDKNEEGRYLGNLGIAYRNLGQYHKAIEYSDKALQIFRGIGDKRMQERLLNNLGIIFDSLEDNYTAIEYFQQALKIAIDIGDKNEEGKYLGNLGITYNSLGQYHIAREHLNRSLIILRGLLPPNHPDIKFYKKNLSKVSKRKFLSRMGSRPLFGTKTNSKSSSSTKTWQYKWGHSLPFDQNRPFLEVVKTAGFELDLPLRTAMAIGWRLYSKGTLMDNVLFRELAHTDVAVIRPIIKDIGEDWFFSVFRNFAVASNPVPTLFALLYDIFGQACSELPNGGIITANRIASGILADALGGRRLFTAIDLALAFQNSFALETGGLDAPVIGPKLRDHLTNITGIKPSV